jgi:hypothetical protein
VGQASNLTSDIGDLTVAGTLTPFSTEHYIRPAARAEFHEAPIQKTCAAKQRSPQVRRH